MGRQVERVPIGFDWPMKKIWFGYDLEPVDCQLCGGTGKPKHGGKIIHQFKDDGQRWESDCCPCCEGEGKVYPRIEIPEGPGWQMWENVSEGSPMSPVFETAEELAHWLADTGASAFADQTASYEQWMSTIREGSAWSASLVGGRIISGVEDIHNMREERLDGLDLR